MTASKMEAFTPLRNGPANGEKQEFRVLAVEQAGAARPFKAGEEKAPGMESTRPAAACEPRVSLQRDGEKITSIKVECGCGQVVELVCSY